MPEYRTKEYGKFSYGASESATFDFRTGNCAHLVNVFSEYQRHIHEQNEPDGGKEIQVLATSSSHKNVYYIIRVNHVPIRMMADIGYYHYTLSLGRRTTNTFLVRLWMVYLKMTDYYLIQIMISMY